ncbi:nitroreductase [Clostridia bacterium]|nr:nitroreductase [Clostridia bacterium]
MNFSGLARDRYSVRNFKAQPIEEEKLGAILEAGRIAPTACNYQPQRIKVVTGDDLVKIDASIVTTHLMLATHEQGLGSCWVAHFDPAKLTELFALSENIVPVALLPIGYPVDDAKPAAMHTAKNKLEDILL